MQAFSGIRVLDFTHVYAGPFATQQLAVMGAEVIKIEPPDNPDQMRFEGVDEDLSQQGLGTTYLFNNQGKKAMTLNLASDAGKDIARRMITEADVLVENYTHGLEQYGLGPEAALDVNPQLIYCDMTAYGHQGRFGGRPAYDPVVQASSGMMSLNGRADQEYIRVGPPLIDYGTGAQTAFAIAAALYQRMHTGKGQVIEVNMQDAALVMMSPLVSNALHAGATEERTGNGSDTRPGYAVYRCRDDDLMVGAFTLNHHRRLFDLLKLEDRMDIPGEISRQWVREQGASIRQQIATCLLEQDTDHWERCLNQADIPAARVRDLYRMLADEQAERESTSRFPRVSGSPIETPVAAFRYAEHGPEFVPHCAVHGEHTVEILQGLGFEPAEIASLQEQGTV